MMSDGPAPAILRGTIVYNREGHEGRYVTTLPNGGHVVRPAVIFHHADPDIGEDIDYRGIAEWPEVYAKPPVAKLNAEVSELNKRIETQRKVLETIRAEQRTEEQLIAARRERLKQHQQLAQLDDYLAGKITHFVVLEHNYDRNRLYGVRIDSFKDALSKDKRWGRDGMKLLSLFGDSKGDLTWHINDYAYDSGNSKETVIPCSSWEQAHTKAREIYERKLADWRKDPAAHGVWTPHGLVKHAEKLGLPIPQDAVAANEADKLVEANEKVAEAHERLAKAEAELQAVLRGESIPEGAPRAPKTS